MGAMLFITIGRSIAGMARSYKPALHGQAAREHRGHGPLLQTGSPRPDRARASRAWPLPRCCDGRPACPVRAGVCSIPCRIAILGRDE